MMFEQFSQGTSLLHHGDVRIKIVSALVLVPVLALSRCPWVVLTGLIAGLTLVAAARLDPRSLARRLVVVNGFVLFLWLTLPLTYPGHPIAAPGPLVISGPGVALAALITLKANSIVLLLIALLATSTVADIGYGLERLKLPRKLCLLLLFSYRYIFVIHQEYQRLARAARVRCFRPGTNLHTYRTFGYLLAMTLLKSWQRAERVRQAMLLRGFQGEFHSINQLSIKRGDLFFLGVMVALAIMLLTGEILLARP